MVNVIKI